MLGTSCHNLATLSGAFNSYNKNGDYIIGAILPLTKDSGNGKCTDVNPEGKKVLISSSEYPPSISKTL